LGRPVCKEKRDQEENEVYLEWTGLLDHWAWRGLKGRLVKLVKRDHRENLEGQARLECRDFEDCLGIQVTMAKKDVLGMRESLATMVNQEIRDLRACRVCLASREHKENEAQRVHQEKMEELGQWDFKDPQVSEGGMVTLAVQEQRVRRVKWEKKVQEEKEECQDFRVYQVLPVYQERLVSLEKLDQADPLDLWDLPALLEKEVTQERPDP